MNHLTNKEKSSCTAICTGYTIITRHITKCSQQLNKENIKYETVRTILFKYKVNDTEYKIEEIINAPLKVHISAELPSFVQVLNEEATINNPILSTGFPVRITYNPMNPLIAYCVDNDF